MHSVEELFPPTNNSFNPLTREPTSEDRDWLRDRLGGRFSGISWLLSPEPEEEHYSLETLTVPEILKSVGHQGPEAIVASMALSEEQQRAIQVATTGQRTNPNWHLFRKGRLTASNFGAVLRSKRVTASLIARVLGQQQALDGVLSVQWGTMNECEGVRAFTTATQMQVHESGLWLSQSGVLGASPDGLVGSSAVLEVKCPYGAREMTISEALQIKGFCVSKEGETFSLREEHHYWHQVQGQLHLTARKKKK
ncbi:uncharacterized protein LOC117538673 [Gymnodraco acuticeps]|uniref:Uncharacterized protein LOC117538673 n=1 Tax=Gymnodraco acuticeps TaxID=8218 RepID=A0A6P8TXM9_GYMAC|nr:uncharacterized protein LOC117538673 [Gymnodraco acuticeps]